MLQGLAINTIAVPKERWYPNYLHSWRLTTQVRNGMTVEHPKVFLQAIDWYNLLGVGQSNVGVEGFAPWDWALGLSASYSFAGLTHVASTVGRPEKNWQHVYRMGLDGDARIRWTALNTAFHHPSQLVETISVDDEQVTEMFGWLRQTGHKPSKTSIGWTGNLTLILPALNTICVSSNLSAPNDSIAVTVPDDPPADKPTFSLRLGPVPSMNFTGANCSITFRQALFPVNFWIVNMNGADISFNGYGTEWNKNIVYEPAVPFDHNIVQSLAIQARDSIPRIKPMVQSASLLNHFLFMSRMLQKADTAVNSDAAGLSILIAVLLQNMLGVSNKYRSPLPSTLPSEADQRVTSYPLQWQLYGAGPRLAWEWLAAVILLIAFSCFCFGLYQTLRYRMGPGFWMELGGMMMLAQASPPLEDIRDEEKARKRLYWVEKEAPSPLVLKSKAG